MVKSYSFGLTESIFDSQEKLQNNINYHRQICSIGELLEIPISNIRPKPNQPRTYFNEESLIELAQSIESVGLIKPILVRQISDHEYELIAGERRWRAATIAGLQNIPALVKEVSEYNADAISLIENLQSEKLAAIEEAKALQDLISKYKLTQDQLALLIGSNRSTISNLLRLLTLCDYAKEKILSRDLSKGHAKLLISLNEEQQIQIINKIMNDDLSVKSTSQYLKKMNFQPENKKRNKILSGDEIDKIADLRECFLKNTELNMEIRKTKNSVYLVNIEFDSLNKIEWLISHFK